MKTNALVIFTECGPCYGLVQDAVNNHRDTLKKLENMTSNISTQDINQGNDDFESELQQLNTQIDTMKDTAAANLSELIVALLTPHAQSLCLMLC